MFKFIVFLVITAWCSIIYYTYKMIERIIFMPKKYTNEVLQQAYDLIVNKGYSANKTSKILGIDNGTMRKRLKEKYGQIFLPNGKKHVNSLFFNEIDTEEKAYWLGFLTADGYVQDLKDSIELCLAEIDKEHIEKFKRDIESSHKIGKKTVKLNDKLFNAYRISIKDKQMANDLRKYGFTSNKSYDAYIPIDQINNKFINHYIRGFFDGDGSIYLGTKNKNLLRISLTTASSQMCKDFFLL